jgi:small conductance mechanosensitive channel
LRNPFCSLERPAKTILFTLESGTATKHRENAVVRARSQCSNLVFWQIITEPHPQNGRAGNRTKEMGLNFDKFWESARHMAEVVISRLPSLILAIVVFFLFYILSAIAAQLIRRTTRRHRENLGMVFSRLVGAATLLLGFLVSFSIVAPSFQAGDLIKLLGIGSVAIGFAFQNILQNFLAGLLLLWSEPFRVGDEIKIDSFEGTVVEIQTRATIVKTYDERRVVIPNADLFTHSVIVNTANDIRRWEYDFTLTGVQDVAEIKSRVVDAVGHATGTLSDPAPEVLLSDLSDLHAGILKVRAFWWTRAPRQHEMLTSYDAVLTAIQRALGQSETRHTGDRDRAA